MKRGSIFTRVTAVISALVLTFSALGVAGAANPNTKVITDETEKAEYLNTFNTAVNAVKSEKPYLVLTTESGISNEDIDENFEDAMKVFINSFMNSYESLATGLFNYLMEKEADPSHVTEILKGINRNKLIPVSGTAYVSALDNDDKYTMTVEKNPKTNQTTILLSFADYTLDTVKESPLPDCFDLADGTIDPIIINSKASQVLTPEGEEEIKTAKIEDFAYKNARIMIVVDSDGQLVSYQSVIDYDFNLTLYDFMKLLTAYTGLDIMKQALDLANVILQYTGKDPVEMADLLADNSVYISYRSAVKMNKLDWSPRYFGDIDNDGKVSAYDARAALRHAVGLALITDLSSQVYADINFDGDITAADARLILRTTVGLETLFDTPPSEDSIKIVPSYNDHAEEETPSEEKPDPDNPDDNPEEEKPVINQYPTLADIATSIVGIIDGVKGITNETAQEIRDLVAGIIAHAKA